MPNLSKQIPDTVVAISEAAESSDDALQLWWATPVRAAACYVYAAPSPQQSVEPGGGTDREVPADPAV